jgi:pre-mRNA-splicing factor 18
MDFASLMSKEIAKSKATGNSDKRHINRREAEEARRDSYLAEQKALEEERKARAEAKRKREEEAAQEAKEREEKRRRLAEESRKRREEKEAAEERERRKRLGLPELPPSVQGTPDPESGDAAEEGGDDGEEVVPDDELMKRLRELGQPATLFGEGNEARLKRYRKLTSVVNSGPVPTVLRPVEERDMKLSGEVPKAEDKAGRKWLYRQLASYFNMVLREWEIALQIEGNKDTFAGKAAVNAMLQSKESMKPVRISLRHAYWFTPPRVLIFYDTQLFRKFENGELDDSILGPIVEIVKAAQGRRYVDANDGYLRLSIGKAAWPIGVTMVGIHERSAREKLHDGERGHVMGDEVTRKYLQSIKRCLTFAQVRWPPDDVRQLMG